MATSLISSVNVPSISSTGDLSTMGSSVFRKNTSFLSGDTKKLLTSHFSSTRRLVTARKLKPLSASKSFDHIPKQFREENLKDGLMDNFKSAPQCLYGLPPSQLAMFTTEDNSARRLSEKVELESLSSARSYRDYLGMYSLSGKGDGGHSRYRMSASMFGGRARGRIRSAPPDLPSLLMDARICYIGMPLVPAVTELIIAELLYLDYDNPSEPIYIYLNSTGTQDASKQLVADDFNAYAIADAMSLCKSKIYTVNVIEAYGQAAMLLSLGVKGKRFVKPMSFTRLYLPRASRSSGVATDMWIKAKELDVNTGYYIELLAKGIGKSKEEIRKDIQFGKAFTAKEAIEYGIADKIIEPGEEIYKKWDKEAKLRAQLIAKREAAGRRAQAAPSENR